MFSNIRRQESVEGDGWGGGGGVSVSVCVGGGAFIPVFLTPVPNTL